MKKHILLLAFALGICGNSFAQKGNRGFEQAPEASSFPRDKATYLTGNQTSSLLCRDTLRYPSAKQQVFGAGNPFYFFDVWSRDNEAISQTFLLNGETIQIHGVEVIARNSPSDPSVGFTNNISLSTVNVAIYNVNTSNAPTTLIGSTTITVNGFSGVIYYANFSSALTVSSNYAVVLTPTTTSAVVDFYINDIRPNQSYDEDFCRLKSTYPNFNSGGQFVAPPTYTTGHNGGPYNFDLVVSPIVSYTINAVTDITPIQVCLGTAVSLAAQATPTNILSNRMFNYNKMISHFNTNASDSTYVWDMNDPNNLLAWSKDHSYTYTAAGTYTTRFYILGGMGTSCLESIVGPTITVNPIPTVSASAASSTICNGSNTTLTASGANTYSWDNGAGTNATATVAPSTSTTYTVTGTSNGCSNTAQVAVAVNPMSGDASFAYTGSTYCSNAASETPSSINAGVFTAIPAGLDINATTGEIDFSASTAGTYVVTKIVTGTCPDTITQSITISTVFDASFSYSAAVLCIDSANELPIFPAGASAGTFSSSADLVINAVTGEIDVNNSTPGVYTVTNAIAAAGGCAAATSTYQVEIAATFTATISGGGTACVGDAPIDVIVTLTGNGPWDFTYSDGTNATTIVAQATSPYTIQAAASGTYTLSNATNGACSVAGSGSANVVFNALPVLTIDAINDICVDAAAITLTATPAGGTFAGNGVVGNAFDPVTAGLGSHTITYDYTDGNACSNQSSAVVEVTSSPNIVFNLDATICIDATAITLTVTPAGGTFSGNGVVSNVFDPAVAGIGTHAITYVYAENGCSESLSQDIEVKDCLSLNDLSDFNLSVYPNPAQETLVIDVKSNNEIKFSLMSIDGKVIMTSQKLNEGANFINVSSFASGVYFIYYESSDVKGVEKVIIK